MTAYDDPNMYDPDPAWSDDVPDECDDGWHYAAEEPTAPCPTCGDVA